MEHGVLDTQGVKHLSSPDAEDDLLSKAQFGVPDVKSVRYVPVPGVIGLDIRVHEKEGNPTDLHAP